MSKFFIAIEGPDGAGKTTQAKILTERLVGRQQPALYTNEPTKGPIGTVIRNMLGMSDTDESLARADCMALLFAADRLWHLDNVVIPALGRGHVVVTDRYDLSSLTYQVATGADVTRTRALNDRALRPGLTIVLTISEEEQRRRLAADPAKSSRFDRDPDLQTAVRKAYRYAAVLLPKDLIVYIDADGSEASVADAIWDVVKEHLTRARQP